MKQRPENTLKTRWLFLFAGTLALATVPAMAQPVSASRIFTFTNSTEIFWTTNPANHPRFYRLVRL
jgi:hypothetical protein